MAWNLQKIWMNVPGLTKSWISLDFSFILGLLMSWIFWLCCGSHGLGQHGLWNLGQGTTGACFGVIPLPHLFTLSVNPYMSEWKGRLRSASAISGDMAADDADTASFKLSLQQSLLDPIVVQQYQEIFKPMLAPITDALKELNALVDSPRKQLKVKDQEVADLRTEVEICSSAERILKNCMKLPIMI